MSRKSRKSKSVPWVLDINGLPVISGTAGGKSPTDIVDEVVRQIVQWHVKSIIPEEDDDDALYP